MIKLIMTALAGGVTLVMSSLASSAATLNKAQIEKEIIGKSITFANPKGLSGNVRYFRNGKSLMSNTNFEPNRDNGSWRFKGNQMCIKWKIIRGGKDGCFTLSSTGSKKYKTNTGLTLTVR